MRLRVSLSATKSFEASSSEIISPFALVPTSSRLRTLTDLLSSSSWPTTVHQVRPCPPQFQMGEKKHTEDEVVLCDLAVADLLVERLGAVVDVRVQALAAQLLSDVRGVLLLKETSLSASSLPPTNTTHVWHCNRDDQNLTRRKPEGPFAGKVLRDDGNEAFQ